MRDSPPDSRRAFLGVGAVAAAATAVAALGSGDPAHAAGGSSKPGGARSGAGRSGEARIDERDERAVDVVDCGAVGDGKIDDTAAFTKAIARAAAVRGRVVVPAGDYVIASVTVPLLVKISGVGADVSRYGAATSGGVNLRHLPSSTAPMLVVDGNGVTL